MSRIQSFRNWNNYPYFKICFFAFSMSLIFFSSCKPTEKGYKAAYDAALGKREAAKADVDQSVAVSAFQQEDGPQLKEVNGQQVYVLNQRLAPANNEPEVLPGSYNVAIGTYRMITNSNSQASDLKAEGFNAFPAKDSSGKYYTIAGSFTSLDEAVKFVEQLKKKDRIYVGLPEAPVIIFSPK